MSDDTTFDSRQRWDDPAEAIRSAIESAQAQMWTAVPARIKKHNDNGTVVVQPTIKQKRVKADQTSEWVEWPDVSDVPIQYPGGGGASWTFPMKEGDEVLMVISSRNMDKWWKEGGVQEQAAPFRMHHMNDGFAIPGIRSQPRKLSGVSMSTAQLRTDDGNTFIEFDPEGKVKIKSSTNPVIIEGDLHVTGEIIAKQGADNIHVSSHTHNNVMTGGGHTNKPDNNS